MDAVKMCTKCGKEKPLCDFSQMLTAKDGKYAFCRSCVSIKNKAYRQANKDRLQKADRDRRKGDLVMSRIRGSALRIGVSATEALELKRQPCNICMTKAEDLPASERQLDHDHSVPGGLSLRGFLCGTCNRALSRYEIGKPYGRTTERWWRKAADKYLGDYIDRLCEL